MAKKINLFIIAIIFSNISMLTHPQVQAQINGGQEVFTFLSTPNSARITGLGGTQLTLLDKDPNMGQQNPALYNPLMNKQLSISTSSYLANLVYGNVAYVFQRDEFYTASVGLQYLSYGDFTASDESGNITGEFGGNEVVLILGLSHKKDNWSYGVNLKPVFSGIESYSAFGIASDLGINYYNETKRLSWSLVAKNVGWQIRSYEESGRSPLPFDLQLGVSKRLEHLPFRIMVTLHHLHKWDIQFDDPAAESTDLIFGTEPTEDNEFADMLFRHFIFAGEFYFGKNMQVRLGYNHLRRQELRQTTRGGLLGFSFGVGIKIKRFGVEYGRGNYHFASGNNHLTITTNLEDWKGRNKTKKATTP